MKTSTNNWLLSADADIQVIEKILEDSNITHMTAFHCQQVIEKSFKAIIEEYSLDPIKTNDIDLLYGFVSPKISFIDFDILMIQTLNKLYLDARYPGDLGLLPDGKPSLKQAKEFYLFAKNIYNQVKKEMKSI